MTIPSLKNNPVDDKLIEAIQQDLNGNISQEEIRHIASDIAERFQGATVSTFIPLFIRR